MTEVIAGECPHFKKQPIRFLLWGGGKEEGNVVECGAFQPRDGKCPHLKGACEAVSRRDGIKEVITPFATRVIQGIVEKA